MYIGVDGCSAGWVAIQFDEIVFPPERWAATFRSHAQLALHELGIYLGYSPPPLLERLIEDVQSQPTTTNLKRKARFR